MPDEITLTLISNLNEQMTLQRARLDNIWEKFKLQDKKIESLQELLKEKQ